MTHEPRTSIRASNAPTSLDVAARRGCPLFYSTVSPLWLPFALAVVIGSLMRARYICTHARACIKRSRLYNQRSASENEMASARRACGRIGNCTRARARARASAYRPRASVRPARNFGLAGAVRGPSSFEFARGIGEPEMTPDP